MFIHDSRKKNQQNYWDGWLQPKVSMLLSSLVLSAERDCGTLEDLTRPQYDCVCLPRLPV